MKRHPSPTRRSAIILPLGWMHLEWLLLAFLCLAPQLAFGTDKHWTGTTNMTWATGTNWLEGSPPGGTSDNAVFDRAFSNQPNLGATATVGGLWMTGTLGNNVTISGSTLTLGGGGILMDDAGAFTLTINAPLALGAIQGWVNNSGGLLTITGGINANASGDNITFSGSGNTTISSVVSGPAVITQNNASGTLTLSGNNTYSVGTVLQAGRLNINSATALGTNTFNIAGGTIDNTTAGAILLTNNNPITLGANFTFGGTRNLNLGTGAVTMAASRTITLNGTGSTLTLGGTIAGVAADRTLTVNGLGNTLSLGALTIGTNNTPRTFTIAGTGNTTITGVVSNGGGGASILTYSGSGVLTLKGANTYTGGTKINGGTLQVAATETPGTSGPLGNFGIISFGGGTLQYSASNTFDYSSRFNATANQAYSIDTNSQNVTFASPLTSSGGTLTKLGSGALTLSGANTYSGATTISAGTLQLGNGGTTGSLSTSSAITDNANFTINRSNAVTQGTDFSGSAITGTGSFTQAGSGTTTLNAINTYSGGTTVSAGTLQLSGSGTLGQTSGTLTVNGGTLNLNGTTQTVGNLMGSGGTIVSNAAGTVTLTIGNGNGSGGNYSGVIANGTGTVALTKTGSGTITLSGANTYTGATSVSGGTLLVNGSLASGSAVSVTNSGTVLGGTGTISGAVTVGSGANLLGGTGSAASGTLMLANSLTMSPGSIIELALGASGAHSTLTRTGSGSWTFDPTQAFTFIDLGAQPGTYSNIITGLGSDPTSESGWTITNTGWIGTFNYSGGNISLNVVAVPEPATYLTGLLTLVAFGYHQRRRWRCLLRRHVTSHL